jgi:RimJ/RimL family protein N-acetyltransferase
VKKYPNSNDRVLLETDRLILRQFSEDDLDHIYELDNDPEVMRYINGGIPTPREVIKYKIFPGFLIYADDYPGFGFCAADEKVSGDFLGWFSFRPNEGRPDEVTLGFRLRKSAWGQAYAPEGAQALIEKGFTEMRVRRVVAMTYEKNLASHRVLEKLGLRLVRKFRYSSEDLLKSDTHYNDSMKLWAGDDLEFALEKINWERRSRHG